MYWCMPKIVHYVKYQTVGETRKEIIDIFRNKRNNV